MPPRSRVVAAACAVACVAAAIVLMRAPMRITLVNATLRIDDPWQRPTGLALAALAALAVAAALPRRGHRWLLAGCTAILATAAGFAASSWIEARPDVLTARRRFRRATIPWGDVARVDARQDEVTVWGTSGEAIDIDARRMTPEQRAVLDRTVSRHVKERPPASAR